MVDALGARALSSAEHAGTGHGFGRIDASPGSPGVVHVVCVCGDAVPFTDEDLAAIDPVATRDLLTALRGLRRR